MSKLWTRKQLIEYASGFFLYEALDDDWDQLDKATLYRRCECLAHSPFYDYVEGQEIWNEIVRTAKNMNKVFELNITDLEKEKL